MAGFDDVMTKLGIGRTGATDKNAVAKGGKSTLGQSDFLTLMTAQMKNQDPFDPVDNTQMVAQMAQFSSLAGISEMSTTLKAIQDKLGAEGWVRYASLDVDNTVGDQVRRDKERLVEYRALTRGR